jgi:hypothetical protein
LKFWTLGEAIALATIVAAAVVKIALNAVEID